MALERLVNNEAVGDKISDFSINIGYLALYLENEAGFGVEERDYLLLDHIVEQAKARIQWKGQYTDIDVKNFFNNIHTLLRSLGFRKHDAAASFSEALRKKDLSTFGVLIYLALASEITYSKDLKLPICAIALPYDIFVSWQLSNTVRINWNPTDGMEISDRKCMDKHNFGSVHLLRHIYLSSLDRSSVVSQLYVWRAAQRLLHGKIGAARSDANRAAEMNPNNVSAYIIQGDIARAESSNHIGNAVMYNAKLREAIANYDAALNMHADHLIALQARAEARMRVGNLEGAIGDLTRKLNAMPRSAAALFYRSIAFLGANNVSAAKKDMQHYRRLIAVR